MTRDRARVALDFAFVALMRVVHCGVLAARASPIHMDRTCGGKLLAHFVFRSKSYARVITEKAAYSFQL